MTTKTYDFTKFAKDADPNVVAAARKKVNDIHHKVLNLAGGLAYTKGAQAIANVSKEYEAAVLELRAAKEELARLERA